MDDVTNHCIHQGRNKVTCKGNKKENKKIIAMNVHLSQLLVELPSQYRFSALPSIPRVPLICSRFTNQNEYLTEIQPELTRPFHQKDRIRWIQQSECTL